MNLIGFVQNEAENRKVTLWGEDKSKIIPNEQYVSGLKRLEDFSHAVILFYLDKAKYDKDKHLQRRHQNREDMLQAAHEGFVTVTS